MYKYGSPDASFVSPVYVKDVIMNMKMGKSSGIDGLCAEHLQNVPPILCVFLSLCINAMFVHGHMPAEMGKVTITPIAKNKTGNINDSDNYRPIAVANVISKIVESIILHQCELQLYTSELQFGFKREHYYRSVYLPFKGNCPFL